MSGRLVLYGRRGCHLCDEMRAALQPLLAGGGVELEEFDVDADPVLARAHGARVPVLATGDGRELCHHFLDEAAVRRYLS